MIGFLICESRDIIALARKRRKHHEKAGFHAAADRPAGPGIAL
jgi:hypothetical protein